MAVLRFDSRYWTSSTYPPAGARRLGCIESRKAAFTKRWMFGTLRNDCCSMTGRACCCFEPIVADALIHADIGAAEAIDRLLRIADDEERAADGSLAVAHRAASSSSSSAWSGSVS